MKAPKQSRKRAPMRRKRYPDEAAVFEIVAKTGASHFFRIGEHVVGTGPSTVGSCYLGTIGRCAMGFDVFQVVLRSDVRPLTPVARAMLAFIEEWSR